MVDLIFDEKSYIEDMIAKHTHYGRPYDSMRKVSRYYFSEGYSKDEIPHLLERYLIQCDPDINIVRWQKQIDKCAKGADKYGLIKIDSITVTESEMDKINSIERLYSRCVMFTLLCVAKYSNAINPANENWINCDPNKVYKLANVTIKARDKELIINSLWEHGMISFSKSVDNVNLQVNIIDNKSPVAVTLTELIDLGNRYRMIQGERFVQCQCCNRIVRRTANAQKYCVECGKQINIQKTLSRYRMSASQKIQ